jgi:hypothetical protein
MDDETVAKLAYEETVRRISGQMQVLAGLRARAGAQPWSWSRRMGSRWSIRCGNCDNHVEFVSRGSLSFTIQRQENEELLALPPTDMTVADTTARSRGGWSSTTLRTPAEWRGTSAACGSCAWSLVRSFCSGRSTSAAEAEAAGFARAPMPAR